MAAKELRSKSGDELTKELIELRREQFNLRLQKATGQLGNTARVLEVRRQIARVKTIMNEKARA